MRKRLQFIYSGNLNLLAITYHCPEKDSWKDCYLSDLDYTGFPMFIRIPDLFRISYSILKFMLKQINLYLQQFWRNIEFVVFAIFLLWFHPLIEQHVSTVCL